MIDSTKASNIPAPWASALRTMSRLRYDADGCFGAVDHHERADTKACQFRNHFLDRVVGRDCEDVVAFI